jgi:cytochrome c556
MLRILSVAALVAVGTTAVTAQKLDIIKARKEILKGFGAAAKDPGAMMKGEQKFDAAKVIAALRKIQEGAAKLPDLFPDDSKTGGETEALPVIWEKKQDFVERYKKLAAAAKAAEASLGDEIGFQEGWPKLIGDNCVACHKIYRKPQ